MAYPNENVGTRKDLVLYRLQTAKGDLKSARILLDAEEYKNANNDPTMLFFMLSMRFMQ